MLPLLHVLIAAKVIYINRTDELLHRLQWCESRYTRTAINHSDPNGGSYSYFQFRLSTFEEFGKRYGLPYDDIFSLKEQTDIVRRMIEEGRGEKNWANCFKLMGLNGGGGDKNYLEKYNEGRL